jgi:phosphomannomutase
MSQGVDVYNLGVAPTPAVFREAVKYGAGVIVTASHNPLEWNGLKFVRDGRGLFEDELEAMLAGTPGYPGKYGSEYAASSTYADDIAELTRSNARVKVGLDLGGGAGCGYAERVFNKLGHPFVSVNAVPGVSSRGPDPTADPLSDLKGLVSSNGLDYGFALDLDADRLVVVSKAGEKLGPDATLLLCVARAVQMGMTKFVVSIDTSVAVEKHVRDRGGKVSHSKVGEANVVREMLEDGAEAGGEGSSAGFIMLGFNKCRDGLLAAATISTLDKKSMDDCMAFASRYTQVRSKLAVDSSQHGAVIAKLEDLLRAEASSVITGDGVKAIVDEDSWILVRPSNTEHAIRISVESLSDKTNQLYKKASEKVQSVYDRL